MDKALSVVCIMRCIFEYRDSSGYVFRKGAAKECACRLVCIAI